MSPLTFAALRELADGQFHSGEAVARKLGRSRASLSEALKRAPEMGLDLFSIPGKGYRLARPLEFLDAAAIGQALARAGSRVRVEVVDETDSTSSQLMQRALGGSPSGTCLAAEWQSAGRGRRGRGWVGALGGSLTFSLLWRFERGAGHLGGLSLVAGLAAARTFESLGVPRVQVKWPNDIVVDLRKLAGLLVETSGDLNGPSVAVIGIGVNYRLGERTLERIDQPVVDVAGLAATLPSRATLLATMLAGLEGALSTFDREGFAPFRDAWRERHAYHGRAVRVQSAGEAAYDAEVTDVAPDGALVVRAQGRTLALASAEISLRVR
jgi:BirA family transcriptional regulator, biotin operon repressor / biotin---[acetyl-CoA-carboxylase] ligase